MHEMSLCEGIIDILEREAVAQSYAQVRRIVLEIGPLAGVEVEAMRFAFDAVTHGTLAQGARLDIVSNPARAWCFGCESTIEIGARYDACPTCGTHQWQMLSGDEMQIKEVEVE